MRALQATGVTTPHDWAIRSGQAMKTSPGTPVSVVSAVTRRGESPGGSARTPRVEMAQQVPAPSAARSPQRVAASTESPRSLTTSAAPASASTSAPIKRPLGFSMPKSAPRTAVWRGEVARRMAVLPTVVRSRANMKRVW